jgi:hypothetical protein
MKAVFVSRRCEAGSQGGLAGRLLRRGTRKWCKRLDDCTKQKMLATPYFGHVQTDVPQNVLAEFHEKRWHTARRSCLRIGKVGQRDSLLWHSNQQKLTDLEE